MCNYTIYIFLIESKSFKSLTNAYSSVFEDEIFTNTEHQE